MAFPTLRVCTDLSSSSGDRDLTVVVSPSLQVSVFPQLSEALLESQQYDPRVGTKASVVSSKSVPSGRCLHVPVGQLDRDYDDVRRFFDIGKVIAQHLLELDAMHPLIVLDIQNWPKHKKAEYTHALENIYLGVCQQLWQPLEAREALIEDEIEPVQSIALWGLDAQATKMLSAIESGKRLARDLCGTEPERMAPIGFADYCNKAFKGTPVSIDVVDDPQFLLKEYPCMHAVARASLDVERHHPRLIHLTYQGAGPIQQTLYLAGKGITFDTGGADLKVNGHMAGMSRDKGGAAAVAGIMRVLALLKPAGIRVVASIAAVRNSIGADAYVPDEIITSHAGVRVRIGNTDAEGRMVLTDILSHMREQAQLDENPQVFSFATLTGHAAIAFGPYSALVENQAAIDQNVSSNLIAAGHLWSDPCEQSKLRREDYNFIQPRTKADDVLSSNNAPSVGTVRGHQFPMAYLSIASGLDKHGAQHDKPIAYTHVDIAGSAVENLDWQHGKPTAAAVAAFAASYILPRVK
ncbi:leucyl aminopeptidase family protein [Glaciecola sp. SC05]|uniref:M17 family metallopeptidase n=1 Tax=Glaciecola sp. SC05 TaxID=1987355 RepID=UPI0035295BE8